MSSFDIPIALILFKRRDTTERILKRISLVKPKKLYILSDEGRTPEERKLVQGVRDLIDEIIDWECEVIKNYASENRGVYENIALGAKWVFEKEEMAIFLEDDNLPELSFFDYCKEMLIKYKNDTRVLWVCGTNYLGKTNPKDNSSYYFTQHLLPCGWASWSDKFLKYYDFNLTTFTKESIQRVREEYINKKLYTQQIRNVQREKSNFEKSGKYLSWDYHMIWSLMVNNMCGISPKHNQIKNIGVDQHSEHGGTSFEFEMTRRLCGMDSYNLEFPLINPPIILSDLDYEKKISGILLYPVGIRVRSNIRLTLGRILNLPDNVSYSTRIKELVKRGN